MDVLSSPTRKRREKRPILNWIRVGFQTRVVHATEQM